MAGIRNKNLRDCFVNFNTSELTADIDIKT